MKTSTTLMRASLIALFLTSQITSALPPLHTSQENKVQDKANGYTDFNRAMVFMRARVKKSSAGLNSTKPLKISSTISSRQNYVVDCYGLSTTIDLGQTSSVSTSVDQGWLSVSSTNNNGEASLEINITPNPYSQSRTANVVVQTDQIKNIILITQLSLDEVEDYNEDEQIQYDNYEFDSKNYEYGEDGYKYDKQDNYEYGKDVTFNFGGGNKKDDTQAQDNQQDNQQQDDVLYEFEDELEELGVGEENTQESTQQNAQEDTQETFPESNNEQIIAEELDHQNNYGMAYSDGEVREIMRSTKANPFNLIILGDGFTSEDNVVGGTFDKAANSIVNYFFNTPPFDAYKEYFSVFVVYANSVHRGADPHPSQNTHNTVFNSSYGNWGTDRLLVANNQQKVDEYASKAASKPDAVIVLVNSTKHGGSGGAIATVALNQDTGDVVIHEVGHLFGLADEYIDDNYAYSTNRQRSQAAALPNLDITNDPLRVKWKHFIGRPGYEDVGVFEGGYYFSTGVWRSSYGGMMRDHSPSTAFNAISRETIVKVLKDGAGESYNFDEFLRKDDNSFRNDARSFTF